MKVCIDFAASQRMGMIMHKPFPISADRKLMHLDADELTEATHWFSIARNQEFQVR